MGLADLFGRNLLAYDDICRNQMRGVVLVVIGALLGWALIKLMHNSLVDVGVGLAVLSIPFFIWRFRKSVIEPRYPELFDNPEYRYGIPLRAARQLFPHEVRDNKGDSS